MEFIGNRPRDDTVAHHAEDDARPTACFIGDGTLLIRCAELFLAAGHAISAVVTRDPRAADWARRVGLTLIDKDAYLKAGQGHVPVDFLFSVGNLDVIPPAILARVRRRAINFHDGPLPRHAGLHATTWAILAGETSHGVTWHQIDKTIDTGAILAQEHFDILPTDTVFSLNGRCYEAGASSFSALLDGLVSGRVEARPQRGERLYHGRLKRPDRATTLDFRQPAARIAALVRALDFGPVPNPMARPKIFTGQDLVLVRGVEIGAASGHLRPGTITRVGPDLVSVATADREIVLSGLTTLRGEPAGSLFSPGSVLPEIEGPRGEALAAAQRPAAAHEAFWIERLADVAAPTLPYPRRGAGGSEAAPHAFAIPLARTASADDAAAAFLAWIGLVCDTPRITLGLSEAAADSERDTWPWFLPDRPLTLAVDRDGSVAELRAAFAAERADLAARGLLAADLPQRAASPDMRERAVAWRKIGLVHGGAKPGLLARTGSELVLVLSEGESRAELIVCGRTFKAEVAQAMAGQFAAFLQIFLADPEIRLGALPLVPEEEAAIVAALNATTTPFADDRGIHDEIAARAAELPERDAVVAGNASLTYGELDRAAGELAGRLVAAGIGPGTIVGICHERMPDLVVAVLATLKAGAAYLPLDAEYPRERLAYMLEDSGAEVLLTSRPIQERLAFAPATVLYTAEAQGEAAPPPGRADGGDLAYVIYTSGSTGRPKGVAITHRNLMNFCAGMDARIPHDPPGIWLAATSLSFDISVLEILWTLARGFTVVLHGQRSEPSPGPGFSLFYFSNDDAADPQDKYRLLLEGARFADRNGFEAVWTPERHFHAFGGLYPNAALSAAALAACTERVKIRAGSCVLPLHHPLRVAEDWAMIDNLSKGRAGIAFASGWQPNDFVLAPERFAERKERMAGQIDDIRRLWRGERLPFPNPLGKVVEIGTMPRPIQPELPMWLTAAGNPDTFVQAGRLGCGVLTHLLGQTLEELADKIRQYRQAWREAGHAGEGHVTLMLHTFVGEDEDAVRETVREPMKRYLGSAMDLVRQAAWTFPTFVQRAASDGRTPAEILDAEDLSPADRDALLDHAFERYHRTGGLFGTPESCLGMVEAVRRIGTDEIACLVDFGVPTDLALDHLEHLKRLMVLAGTLTSTAPASVPEDIVRHRVTHFQCTPSMARMLVADAAGRRALAQLDTMMVGGEALSADLAGRLRALLPGRFLGMYGPTETTIWSAVVEIDGVERGVTLGEPIANTTLHVLDAHRRPCPAYLAGELHIGGEGLARGYLGREDLTAERFIPNPFGPGRLYRTGDLVRRDASGGLVFLGRLDHQVKVRGHRIELGEIEAALARQPGIAAAVVVAREDTDGDQRLVGYVTARDGATLRPEALREAVASTLPAFMVPAVIVVLPALPMTLNGKVDRGALPAPHRSPETHSASPEAPMSSVEALIAGIWGEALGRRVVATNENFFDLGGHSLLVVQVQRRLGEELRRDIAITDLFRFPTIRTLSLHLGGFATGPSASDRGHDRAKARQALRRRQEMPATVA
ncbi:MupA/Atu3671 family FMN-dependent luciferase-like monooxygenase [Methylobacterium sp. 88A]|uniref:MupA/Atu3671 family FMN-dependent luciferase-like monooxygenase n=1 Tax=Methylobacterium sp. 88A TaxID=1131813 RepID=UPI0003613275|nr:MupA/Atu3671 family FMN-dependent luciferase-like monooxygenase [Methylobacterium sp. 88A]